MRILVTGGCGFIGTHLCTELLAQGHFVVNIDKMTYAADQKTAAVLTHNENYVLIEGDCTHGGLVYETLKRFNLEAVMHLAAESHVDRSISGPQSFLEANVLGTYGVLEAVRRRLQDTSDFRMVHVSTDEVFGDLPLKSSESFTEDSPYRPSSPYSASKAAADHLVRAWGRTFGVPYVITHGANTYGPGQLPDKLIPMAIVNALSKRPITIHGSGKNMRSWIHVSDHVNALIAVLSQGHIGHSYCVEAGVELSNLEVARLVQEFMTHETEIQHTEDRPGNDLKYSMLSGKLRFHTNWRAHVSFDEGLAQTIRWYQGQTQ